MHQNQRERLPELAGDIFNASTGNKGVSFVEAYGHIVAFRDQRNDIGDAVLWRFAQCVHQEAFAIAISSVFWMDIERVLSGVAIRGLWVKR